MDYFTLLESKSAPLYRAVKNEYVGQMFRDDKLVGSTTQRYWDDGKRRKDDDPEYRGSNWMKGLSFTRDKFYAMQWGDFFMAIDQEKLARHNRIIPFSWGYSSQDKYGTIDHKREREEFVLTHKGGTYETPEEDGSGTYFDAKAFRTPEGEIKGFSDMLLGFWLSEDYVRSSYERGELESSGITLDELIRHPKFKGWYVRGTRSIRPRFLNHQESEELMAEYHKLTQKAAA